MSPTRSVRLISRTVDRRHGRSRAQHEAYLLLPARRHDDCKTTRKIRDPRVTKNYFRAHIAIMNPSHPDKRHASRAGCRAALQVPFATKAIAIIRAATRPSAVLKKCILEGGRHSVRATDGVRCTVSRAPASTSIVGIQFTIRRAMRLIMPRRPIGLLCCASRTAAPAGQALSDYVKFRLHQGKGGTDGASSSSAVASMIGFRYLCAADHQTLG